MHAEGGKNVAIRTPRSVAKRLQAESAKSEALFSLYVRERKASYLDSLRDNLSTEPNAAVLLSLIGKRFNGDSAIQTAATLRAAHVQFPQNGLISICLAATESELGNTTGALRILAEGGAVSGLQTASNAITQVARDASVESGESVLEAWRTASSEEDANLHALASILNGLNNLRGTIEQMDTGNKVGSINLVIAATESLRAEQDPLTPTGATAIRLERSLLELLPPDFAFGENGETIADRIKQLDSLMNDANGLAEQATQSLANMPPETLQSYFERKQRFGPEAAAQWALQITSKP